MKVGYARVSSTGQNLDSQIELLKKVGCEKIYTEKKSGKQTDNRVELKNALEYVREGDEFYVTRLDRCSRSVKDLHTIIDYLNKKNVSFKATEQDLDTSTSTGRLMIGLLSIVSEFETDLRAERQADGIKSALSRGVKFGRKKKLTESQIEKIMKLQLDPELSNQQIAVQFNVGKSTMLREVANYKDSIENTTGYVLVDYNFNFINLENRIYEKLFQKKIDELVKQRDNFINSHTYYIYNDVDFTKEIYEVKITLDKIFLKRHIKDISTDEVLKEVIKFTDVLNNPVLDASQLVFKEPSKQKYDEFKFDELDD